jgi:glycerophosphoryl diester phosphodiesterase
MPLCEPIVVGPVSELTTSIRVQGQILGAKVEVQARGANPRVVADGLASSCDQRFPLRARQQLAAGDILVALQHTAGDQSAMPGGNLGEVVQPIPQSPAQIGTVGLKTHLWQCGQYVYVEGAVPAARVEVVGLGHGIADEGVARFELSAPLKSGVAVAVRQVVSGVGHGPELTPTPDPIPAVLGRALPAPVIGQPLRGCDPSVLVSQVFDGALVTLRHKDNSEESAGFDLDALHLLLGHPLVEGDELSARQQFQGECGTYLGAWSAPVSVGPAKPVDPPVVAGPLCAGSTRISMSNLRPGATVRIHANGKVFEGSVPPDATASTFGVPPLTGGSVRALQEICSVTSSLSAPVRVDPHQDHVPAPAVVGPLFECARCVTVHHAHPGASVQIWAQKPFGEGPISAMVVVDAPTATIAVSPYLHRGDRVFAVQWACSSTSVRSTHLEPVHQAPALTAPRVLDPIDSGDTTVYVERALPGASVEVYVALTSGVELFAGQAVASAASPITSVRLWFPLQVREQVFARQRLCNGQSDLGRPVVVRLAPSFGPRPFYVMAHNPNTISDIKDAVNLGANAVEPDVNVYDSGGLCISEAGITGNSTGDSDSPELVQFLKELKQVADQNPGLALVVFDCKKPACSPGNGVTLLKAIRENLTDATGLNIVISVDNLSLTGMFDLIENDLRPREGLMVDSENDPIAVSNFFTQAGVANQCYGNGITDETILGPNVRPSTERSCEFRAALGRTKFVYVWTVNDDDHMREFIRIGVDSVDTDDVGTLRGIVGEPEFQPLIRLATRDDDSFRPANFNYGLRVHTSDKWMAGTDANVTFRLHGANGWASKTVNTKLPKRMESGDWNYVTIPSDDLGALDTVTVQRDNSGNAPDWHLDRIEVESVRFGVSLHAVYDCWIDTTNPFTRPLVP